MWKRVEAEPSRAFTNDLLHATVEQVIILRQSGPSQAGVGETRIVNVVLVLVFVMPRIGDVDHASCGGSGSRRLRLGATLFQCLELARSA